MSWPLRILRWVYCAVVAWSAANASLDALHRHDTHALVLAVTELIGVGAFLFRTLELSALALLLAAFAISSAMQSPDGDTPLRFLFFGATAAFIVVAARLRTDASSARAD